MKLLNSLAKVTNSQRSTFEILFLGVRISTHSESAICVAVETFFKKRTKNKLMGRGVRSQPHSYLLLCDPEVLNGGFPHC